MADLVTYADLRKFAPGGKDSILRALVGPLNHYLPLYQISTEKRVAHFMCQARHEADQFRTLIEYASGKGYEGRKDLGNLHAGDGVRFKGRGIFQLTGRANYRAYGRKIGLDLEGNPELAAQPDVSVRIACEYWKAKGLNTWADRDDIVEITRRINGGRNGLADRQAALAVAKQIFAVTTPTTVTYPAEPHDARPPVSVPVPVPHDQSQSVEEEIPDAPIAAEPRKKWYESTENMMAGGGILSTLLAAANSPWGFASLAFIVIIVALGFWIWKRKQREDRERPVIS
jgi:predicted chitinase